MGFYIRKEHLKLMNLCGRDERVLFIYNFKKNQIVTDAVMEFSFRKR